MRYHDDSQAEGCFYVICIAVVLLVIIGIPCSYAIFGVGSWGPKKTIVATVISKHIDSAKEASHYMVTTDAGVFEVENGYWLGVTRADAIYGNIIVGQKYRFVVQGNEVVGYFYQFYPYVISTEHVKDDLEPSK